MKRLCRLEIQILENCPISYRRLLSRCVRVCVDRIPQKEWKKIRGNSSRCSLSVSVVSPARMRTLNAKFRGKNRPTDVLSFPLAIAPGSDCVGDVLLSWTIAKRQSAQFDNSPRRELMRLVVHGVLHLFGYDHEISPAEEKRMFLLQDKILRSLTRE